MFDPGDDSESDRGSIFSESDRGSICSASMTSVLSLEDVRYGRMDSQSSEISLEQEVFEDDEIGSSDVTQSPAISVKDEAPARDDVPTTSYKGEERVTDENKPTHTYWTILDDDEKTDIEILELALDKAKQSHNGGVSVGTPTNENNNQTVQSARLNEILTNDFEQETFL